MTLIVVAWNEAINNQPNVRLQDLNLQLKRKQVHPGTDELAAISTDKHFHLVVFHLICLDLLHFVLFFSSERSSLHFNFQCTTSPMHWNAAFSSSNVPSIQCLFGCFWHYLILVGTFCCSLFYFLNFLVLSVSVIYFNNHFYVLESLGSVRYFWQYLDLLGSFGYLWPFLLRVATCWWK